MITKKKDELFYLDFTMMSAWLRCRFYYYFRHVRHLVPMTTAAPLSYGKTWHSAIEILHKGGTLEEAEKHFLTDYVNSERDLKRTPEKGIEMLREYKKKYNPGNMKYLYTETPFSLHLTENIILCGRMDAIVEWNGGIYVFESKTTSSLTSAFTQSFELNYQVDIYALACYELMGRCDGAIIDAARVVKPKTKPDDLLRFPVSRTKDDLYFAKKSLIEIAMEMQNDTSPIYQNKCECMKYFRKCTYHDLCMGMCDERIIRANFKEEVWDPSHNLHDKVNQEERRKSHEETKREERWRQVITVTGKR